MFAPNVWLLLFVMMLLAAVLFHCVAISQFAAESNTYRYIANCMLSAWSMVLGVGVYEMPRSDPLRGVFFLWLMYSLAINTVFQTYVTTYLVDPGYRYQIDSTDDIKVYVIDFLHDFLSDDLLNQMKSWRKCGSAKQCLTAASRSPGVVMLSGKVFVEYTAEEQSGAFVYHKSSLDLFHFHIVMVLKKGSPLLDRINIVIGRLVEAGFPGKFFKDIVHKRNLKPSSELGAEYVPMSISHLQSAFIAMFLGMSLGALLFFGELMTR